MGRWAQRRLRGGGENPLNYITEAVIAEETIISLAYRFGVNVANFDHGDFSTLPSVITASELTQSDATHLALTFEDPIDAEASITYQGSFAGVVHPQLVALT